MSETAFIDNGDIRTGFFSMQHTATTCPKSHSMSIFIVQF